MDGDVGTAITFSKEELLAKDKPQFIQLEFTRPFTARSLQLVLSKASSGVTGVIQASDDGKTFRNLNTFSTPRRVRASGELDLTTTLGSEAVSARFFRLRFPLCLRCRKSADRGKFTSIPPRAVRAR